MNVYTIGYEGLALHGFLQRLRCARIQTVADVRDVPLSRKPGFSKTVLANALDAAGLKYLHYRALGCPKPIRDQYRADRDWEAYTAAFMDHLCKQHVAVGELAGVCGAGTVALLCYEADQGRCHRTFVARAVAALAGCSVMHIHSSGVLPDRANLADTQPAQTPS